MRINGNLTFKTAGASELRNAVIERVAGGVGGTSLPVGAGAVAARILYNTDDNKYYFYNGTVWEAFVTGSTSGNSFGTVVGNAGTAVADVPGDAINIIGPANSGITTTASTTPDTLNITLDINNLPSVATVADTDLIAIYDLSGSLTGKAPLSQLLSNLDVIGGLASNGLVTRTGSGTYVGRTIVSTGSGITVTNGNGVSGNPTLALNTNLQSLAIFNTDGLLTQTSANTFTGRSIVAPAAGITVTNGNGVASNPTLGLANDLAAVEGLSGTGLAVRIGTDSWANRSIVAGTGNVAGLSVSNGNGVATNPTIGYDIANTAAISGTVSGTDRLVIYDGSASTNVSVTVADLASAFSVNESARITASAIANAGTITPGQVVYLVSVNGGTGIYTVGLASATSINTSPACGIAVEAFNTVTPGKIVVFGDAAFNTTGLGAAGDILYVSTTPGTLTNVRPVGAGYQIQPFAVLGAVGVAGRIQVLELTVPELPQFGSGQNGYFWQSDANGTPVPTNFSTSTLNVLTTNAASVRSALDVYSTTEADDEFVNVTGDTLQGNLIVPSTFSISVADAPTDPQHVVNKAYVDSIAAGLKWKQSVTAATTTNISLSGLQTIDGVSVTAGERVLVRSQTNQAENGVYVVNSGAWARAQDFDTVADINGAAVFVEQGSTVGDTAWVETATVTTVGTDPITFAQFSAISNTTIQFNYHSVLHGGPNTTHVVTHNLGQRFVNVSVYDDAFSQVIPQSVVLTNANTTTVTFNAPIDCYIVVMGVPGVGLA